MLAMAGGDEENAMSYDDFRFLALDELRRLLGLIERDAVERLVELLSAAPRIYVVGAGRSGLVMRGFAMRLMHLGRCAFVVGEPITPALRSGDLLIAGSGSGATESLVVLCEKAKRLGATLALVTTARDSSIGRIADLIVEIPAETPKREERAAVPERATGSVPGVKAAEARRAEVGGSRARTDETDLAAHKVVSTQPMAALFEQALWLLLDSIILVLMERSRTRPEEMFSRHANLE